MTKSRRTNKQQLQRQYEAFLQEEKAEEERLQREEDEYWAQKMVFEDYLAERQQREFDADDDDFDYCWLDYDPFFDDEELYA